MKRRSVSTKKTGENCKVIDQQILIGRLNQVRVVLVGYVARTGDETCMPP
jgi:hypothetical protein